MSLRKRFCVALSWLDLHEPDCEHCAAQDCVGLTIGRRLKELNEHAQRSEERNLTGEVRTPGNDAA